MKRKELLEQAAKITNGERQDHYGTPEDNFARIAELWNAYTGVTQFSAHDVAAMMILLRLQGLHQILNILIVG